MSSQPPRLLFALMVLPLILSCGGTADDGADVPTDTASDVASDGSAETQSPDVIPVEDTGPVDDEGTAPDEGDDPPDVGPSPRVVPFSAGCENINPLYCGLPWPSDRYLEPDETSSTGFRVAYEAQAVPGYAGQDFDVSFYNRFDGFSPSSQIITLFAEPADLSGVAGSAEIADSLADDHPTVLLDLETGERVAHWVENDARAESPEETLFYVRPATRLAPGRAYAVAIRGVNGVSGAPLEPSEAFIAFRDGLPLAEAALEARRSGFEEVFAALEGAGVERASLIIAWRFRTASDESTRGTLLAMRAAALEELGDDGIGCKITSVQDDFKQTGARRIRGTYTVPWFMSAPLAPATLVRDQAGVPILQGTEEIGFTAIVSAAALQAPGPLITWGHGLFGEAEGTISNKAVIAAAEASGAVVVATDWHGMSKKDLPFLASALIDVSKFYMVGENLMQGMINKVALTRSFLGVCAQAPELLTPDGASPIDPDPSRSYFVGGSQGSILGGTYLTLAPDIERGALVVGGATFSFMIERSIHFKTFELVLQPAHESRLVVGALMALSQHVWDMGESAAWLGAAKDGLDGVGPKRFVYLIAHNDAQVPNLSSDIAARIAGLGVLDASVRKPWGVPVVTPPLTDSAYIAFDVGDPPNPEGNLAPEADAGGHGSVGFVPAASKMIADFLATGEIDVDCGGGACVFE